MIAAPYRLVLLALDQIDRPDHADAADIADRRVRAQFLEPLAEVGAVLGALLDQILLIEDLEVLDRRRGRPPDARRR